MDLTSLAVYPAASWATTVQLFCSRLRVVTSGGIAAPYFQIIESHEAVDGGKLNYPVFVKPARSGSFFGVSKVTNGDELSSALEAALALTKQPVPSICVPVTCRVGAVVRRRRRPSR